MAQSKRVQLLPDLRFAHFEVVALSILADFRRFFRRLACGRAKQNLDPGNRLS
jgi:hypothetical protein